MNQHYAVGPYGDFIGWGQPPGIYGIGVVRRLWRLGAE